MIFLIFGAWSNYGNHDDVGTDSAIVHHWTFDGDVKRLPNTKFHYRRS
ncbi:MAG: hypothetical protein ACTSVK_17930 [Promethearchaeota archaeon]